jgi:hypothetical protein
MYTYSMLHQRSYKQGTLEGTFQVVSERETVTVHVHGRVAAACDHSDAMLSPVVRQLVKKL